MSSGTSECLSIIVQNVSSRPAGLWKCWTKKTYFYANSARKHVVIRLPFFPADLKCPPELNCTENYGIIAFSAQWRWLATLSWLWHFCWSSSKTLQDVTPSVNINLLTPTSSPLPALCFFFPLVSFSFSSHLTYSRLFFAFIFPHKPCFHLLLYAFHLPSSVSALFEGRTVR